VDAIVGLDGRRVLAVVPLVDGTELIFDGDYNGNLVTVDSDGSFHIGSANIEALAEHDPIYAGIWDRLNGNVTDLTVVSDGAHRSREGAGDAQPRRIRGG
jgi:hypothetical protein